MPRHFYAADNIYSSPTDIGFYDTWYVLVFDSKSARDTYVNNSHGLAAKIITRKEVTEYASTYKPEPFTSQCWGIRIFDSTKNGAIGVIEIMDFSEAYIRSLPDKYQRFHK